MKYFIIIFFFIFISCESKRKLDNNSLYLDFSKDTQVYQKIEIFHVQKNEERFGKTKTIKYLVSLTNSNQDTSFIETNTIFYKGVYWAETIERNKKVIFLLSAEEYETVKLN